MIRARALICGAVLLGCGARKLPPDLPPPEYEPPVVPTFSAPVPGPEASEPAGPSGTGGVSALPSDDDSSAGSGGVAGTGGAGDVPGAGGAGDRLGTGGTGEPRGSGGVGGGAGKGPTTSRWIWSSGVARAK
nr:MAG: hypothetical protein DIU78_17945 [Pseudomonadota bacterium]